MESPHVSRLLQLWSLGDRLQARLFKNSVMEKIYDIHSPKDDLGSGFGVGDAEWCWTKIPEDSKLRNFFVDVFPQLWTYQKSYKGIKEEWGDFLMKHPDLARLTLLVLAGKYAKEFGPFEPTPPLEAYLD
jgi:hypothetical protein